VTPQVTRTGSGHSRKRGTIRVNSSRLAAIRTRKAPHIFLICQLILAGFRPSGCRSGQVRDSFASLSVLVSGMTRKMSVRHDFRGADGMPAPPTEPRPVRRVLVFTIVALALFMMSVDSTIVATALYSLRRGLHTSINWAGWTITAYSFGLSLMLPLSGKLSERYGRRRVFIGSVVVFTAASLSCGLATNIYMLIALRAVQAAGGAGFTPSATAIVVDYFGPVRDRAVSLFGSIFPIGAMTGPIFGGLFVSYWTWRGVFFVNVPIGVAVIMLALRYVPRDRPSEERTHQGMDAAGIALLGIGLLTGMFAASYLGERNARASSTAFVAPLTIAIVALWIFVRHINHSAHPFIPPRLIYGPGFGPVNLVNLLYSGVTFGMMALVPLYATNRYGINALGSGTLLTAQGIAAITLSIVAALALRRTGHRPPLYVGSAVVVIGMLLLALRPVAAIPPYGWLAGSAFLVGVGTGMSNPASRNAGLQLAPGQASTLAALRSMCLQLGSMVTISIATAFLASSDDPGSIQAWVYVAAALMRVATMPLIARVPEHRGSW
jgi:EmrB/QacA subfamily drug resistance transporter